MSQRRKLLKQQQANRSWLRIHWRKIGIVVIVLLAAALGRYRWLNRPEALVAKASSVVQEVAAGSSEELAGSKSREEKKLVLVWRVFHSGPQLAPKLAEDREAMICFLRHHDQMLKVQISLFEKLGPDRYRCIAEAFSGENEIREVRALLPQLRQFEKLASAALSKGEDADRALSQIAQILKQSPGSISMFTVQGRLATYLAESQVPKAAKVFYGADLRNSKQLGDLTRERLVDLVAGENPPSDKELQRFFDQMRNDINEDGRKRHGHIAETISSFPDGAVVSVLLGSSHSKYGERIEKQCPDPSIEDEISRIALVIPQVWEQRDHNSLLKFMRESSAHVLSPDSSIDELREIVAKVRESLRTKK